MKNIAICCLEDNEHVMISERLGRSPWIAIYSQEDRSWRFWENTQNLNAPQGAGIQTAQNIINAGAQVLITRNAGPKAMRVLQQTDIEIFEAPSGTNITECINLYEKNELKQLEDANVEGHWV
ncbi:MAG: NifB/NifX family molybdenum-iron cluster-binding protein [Sedimentisphaeraceae bacterium JB056]